MMLCLWVNTTVISLTLLTFHIFRSFAIGMFLRSLILQKYIASIQTRSTKVSDEMARMEGNSAHH